MDFYNCPYVDVIPFRYGNEYDEAYGCAVTRESCQGCACKLSTEECEWLFREQKNQHFGSWVWVIEFERCEKPEEAEG